MKFSTSLGICLTLASSAAMALGDAVPYSLMTVGADPNYTFARDYDFGYHHVSQGDGAAYRVIGSELDGTPYIQAGVTTSSTTTSNPNVTAYLTYNWMVTSSNSSDRSPVLVHVNTAGWLSSVYGFVPNLPDTYNLVPNYMTIAASAWFGTQTQSYVDQRTYGLQTGNVNWGITRLDATDNFVGQNGGTSTVSGSFSADFDVWAVANVQNSIRLDVTAFMTSRGYSSYMAQYAREYFSVNAYIDPTIQVDNAFASNYGVQISNIPVATIPEPEMAWMALAGLGALGAAARKRMLTQHKRRAFQNKTA